MKRLGQQAEDLALAYLEGVGMKILARNVRTPDAEIDILAREDSTIVIVEVKARQSRRFGNALGAVDARKRARLRAAAANLAQFAPTHLKIWRFDVVTISFGMLRHYRGAFS